MVKIVKSWGIQGKRDSLGNMTNPKFMVGTDASGNLYVKHLEECQTNMNLVDINYRRARCHFACPKCSKTLWLKK